VIDFETFATGNFAGDDADHPNAIGNSGNMSDGTASGQLSTVLPNGVFVDFTLSDTGMSAGADDPGIAATDEQTDADRGFNVTQNGQQYLEVLPSESSTGLLHVTIPGGADSVGFFLMGRETNKRDVSIILHYSDGTLEEVINPTAAHQHDIGGVEFISLDVLQDCASIIAIQFVQPWENDDGSDRRDIFSLDDLYISASPADGGPPGGGDDGMDGGGGPGTDSGNGSGDWIP
jgi:hypothetical protein